jgi:signal transduction histidine kinase
MQQLFLNLLSNAVKFRKPGVEPHISVMYEHKDEFSEERMLIKYLYHFSACMGVRNIKAQGLGFQFVGV